MGLGKEHFSKGPAWAEAQSERESECLECSGHQKKLRVAGA